MYFSKSIYFHICNIYSTTWDHNYLIINLNIPVFFKEIEKRNIYVQSFIHTYIFNISCGLRLSCGPELTTDVLSSLSGRHPLAFLVGKNWAGNSLNFCRSGNVFISPSFPRNIFVGYLQVCLCHFTVFGSLLFLVRSQLFYYCIVNALLVVNCFSLAAFKISCYFWLLIVGLWYV